MSIGKKIASARKRAKPRITQAALGAIFGISSQAVSQWERDETVPEIEKIPVIARKLKVSEKWLLSEDASDPPFEPGEPPASADIAFEADAPFEAEAPDDRAGRTVKVIGYVGAGAEGHFYAVAPGDLDEVAAPDATDATVALEIRGESLGSFFDRWLVFYDDVRRPVSSDLIGKLCIVELVDGRVLIKKIRRAKTPGLFDLISQTEEPIRGVAIEWAAKVKNMEPR